MVYPFVGISFAAADISVLHYQDLICTAFCRLVRDATGCGELTDKTDCSCNVYAKGGHLLCHDDVIGTRCVSYIIYLTDPDDKWTAADGGALELYPLSEGKPHTPDVTPTVLHLPLWNTMAMFTVQPGRSFHSVQVRSGRDRDSCKHPQRAASAIAMWNRLASEAEED